MHDVVVKVAAIAVRIVMTMSMIRFHFMLFIVV